MERRGTRGKQRTQQETANTATFPTQQVLLRAPLLHAPGASITVVELTPSNKFWCQRGSHRQHSWIDMNLIYNFESGLSRICIYGSATNVFDFCEYTFMSLEVHFTKCRSEPCPPNCIGHGFHFGHVIHMLRDFRKKSCIEQKELEIQQHIKSFTMPAR